MERALRAPAAGLPARGWHPYENGGMSTAFTTRILDITTGSTETVADLTADCAAFLADAAAGGDGLLNVFVPHATAGIAVLETGAGSDEDLLAALRDLLPADNRWRHRHGSPGHAATMCSPRSCPHMRPSRSSTAGWPSAPGSRSASSIRMSTIPIARCG